MFVMPTSSPMMTRILGLSDCACAMPVDKKRGVRRRVKNTFVNLPIIMILRTLELLFLGRSSRCLHQLIVRIAKFMRNRSMRSYTRTNYAIFEKVILWIMIILLISRAPLLLKFGKYAIFEISKSWDNTNNWSNNASH